MTVTVEVEQFEDIHGQLVDEREQFGQVDAAAPVRVTDVRHGRVRVRRAGFVEDDGGRVAEQGSTVKARSSATVLPS
ncbi:hypothetical protein [Streptomyces sp. NPDC016845]|uniref:hypothetical protein n=1 Tax=Streptomyces sp. NPDC016845 TaxID=3364972 RepID=UPI00378C252B